MQKLEDVSNIVGILNYGPFCGKNRKKLIIHQVMETALILVVMGLGITLISLDQVDDPSPIAKFIMDIILYIVVFLSLSILSFVFFCKNEKMRKKVQLWMEDAVIIKAQSKKIGHRYTLFVPCPKIQVKFELNGIEYQRQSQNFRAINKREDGYYRIWSKYADKEIMIAYSPKYDEIMVLKDKKMKRI